MVSSSSHAILTIPGEVRTKFGPRGRPDGSALGQIGIPGGKRFAMMIKLALLIAIYCVIMLFPRLFSHQTDQDAEGAAAS
jgi:hypothetical protein